ncbi:MULTISPECIES: MarR family transcriptional regulator [Pandoraea]|uniref:Uncharacterized protein n=1 Tax=Pandoraea pnomenusa TaxID=93220 RepID=A0A378YTM4_9BURK|nr:MULTISPECIES: MarR family transcriptional regulator [Pandoraea]AHB07501.1 hypothetical protein U875_20840 [Pandoraea pnomenusa 3kgm]AHB76308.1 hypothetical protein X636_13335 [Pandoraea pnomenusa]AIU28053.1 hypothetical protein LV28_17170 [Pandoraea pnomenusa]MBN9093427.1 MarR family transcriptional regulator [Pandoraea pnomenusa]SUA79759.1 Uncharacterised protein [Pandoraea pnomenusa]
MKSQDIFLLLKLVSLSRRSVRGDELSDPGNPVLDSSAHVEDERHDWSDEKSGSVSRSRAHAISLHEQYSVRSLAVATGISKSEISNILQRCYRSGLAKLSVEAGHPVVNTKALCEFITFGIRYVFPASMGEMTRGIATGLTAPIFGGALRAGTDFVPVWPDPKGDTSGLAVEPLFRTVPRAVRVDADLYAMLALVDSIRIGQPREKKLAASKLEALLRG